MNTDELNDVLDELMHTLEDGAHGFTSAAEKLEAIRPDIAVAFRLYADQRFRFHEELKEFVNGMGGESTDSGTLGGMLHRGWMGIKDTVSTGEPNGVLDVAEQGENHAASVYARVCDDEELPHAIRVVVDRQRAEVVTAQEHVNHLRHMID